MSWIDRALAAAGAALMLSAPAQAKIVEISGEAALSAPGFGALEDGDRVRVDLVSSLEDTIGWRQAAHGFAPEECPFGALAATATPFVPETGERHLLVEILVGDPMRHAGNLASCEYSLAGGPPRGVLRVRGCFHALSLSIPTAKGVVLHPLPARDCEPDR